MPRSKVAVLVVEDMPQARATAVGIMQALGCTVFGSGTFLGSGTLGD